MNEIILTATGLLIAHFSTDFVFQTRGIILSKQEKGWRSMGLLIHALTAAILAVILAWEWDEWIFIGILTFVSHWIIDFVKVKVDGSNTLRAFVLDQVAHLLIIFIILMYIYPQLALALVLYQDVVVTWPVYLLGLLLLYRPSGFLIEHAIRKWSFTTVGMDESLPEAGKWIGYLERLLIFIFIMMHEYSAIGFLIAAKSILRFRDHPHQQKHTEYILLGTLLSFTIAIVISLLIQRALNWLGSV